MTSPDIITLIVDNSRTTCPDCGKVVKVNVRREFLHSHQKPDSLDVCPVKTRFRLQIESLDPNTGKIKPHPTPKKKKKKHKPIVRTARGVAPDGPEKSTSVRAYLGGAPGQGRSRKH